MFQRILVPLDGSERAEHALPVAIRLVRASKGTIVLVHIVHPPSEVGEYGAEPEAMAVLPTSHEKHLARGERYLQHLLDIYRPELTGVHVEQEVETGATAEAIFSVARLEHVDLIVICSHDAHPLLHWMVRSVTREIVHHSLVPILVLKERGLFLEAPQTRRLRVLVPLDGSRLAETAFMPAFQLLTALVAPEAAEIHLLRVVDLPAIEDKPLLRAYDIRNEEEQAVKDAEGYLQQIAQCFAQRIPAEARPLITWSYRVSRHVGRTLANMAKPLAGGQHEYQYDFVSMATHGRTGFQRLRLGSVTEHVLRATSLPLLVVRPSHLMGGGRGATGTAPEVEIGT